MKTRAWWTLAVGCWTLLAVLPACRHGDDDGCNGAVGSGTPAALAAHIRAQVEDLARLFSQAGLPAALPCVTGRLRVGERWDGQFWSWRDPTTGLWLCGLCEGGPHRFTVTVATDPAVGTFSQVVLRHEICHALQVRNGIGGNLALNPHPSELAGICPYWSGPALVRGIACEELPCPGDVLTSVVAQDGQGGWVIMDVAADPPPDSSHESLSRQIFRVAAAME